MDELEALRGEIDRIDRELVELYRQRREVTAQVGRYKLAAGAPVTDRKREETLLEEKRRLTGDPALYTDITELFELIMSQSRRQQRELMSGAEPKERFAAFQAALMAARRPVEQPSVAYQGQPGAYSEEAAFLFFGESARLFHVDRFGQVFQALAEGAADYGVVPIENSSTGAINDVYDLLGKYGCYIVGEQNVTVSHCLMAPAGARLESIREVYSHEQGFFQSEEFLKGYPEWERVRMLNTAASAKFVAERGDRSRAAIASRRAAELYGLSVLAERINFSARNSTRFVVVSPVPELREGCDKISARFTLEHESGSLYRVLSVFALHRLNLLKIESRPMAEKNWEYQFYADFTGRLEDPEMADVVRGLIEASSSLRILGNYRADAGARE